LRNEGNAVVKWVRHCATSWKVEGPRPSEMNEFLLINLNLPVALGPGVYSAFDRNEYQKHRSVFGVLNGGRRVRLLTLPPSVSPLPRQCGILNI
jgi:hypothetical protein